MLSIKTLIFDGNFLYDDDSFKICTYLFSDSCFGFFEMRTLNPHKQAKNKPTIFDMILPKKTKHLMNILDAQFNILYKILIG